MIRAGACALALGALAIAAVVFVDVLGRVGHPWPGFGMLPDGSVAPLALSPLRLADDARPLRFNDRVVAVDGVPVASAAEVRAAVERAAPGTRLRYTVR